MNNMQLEYLLCAAIHFQDGNIYPHEPINIDKGFVVLGRRHHNIFSTIKIIKGCKFVCSHVQGFVTSNNRFVDRVEALEIATKANQIRLKVGCPTELFSEDLY